jgi:hypothetical protein
MEVGMHRKRWFLPTLVATLVVATMFGTNVSAHHRTVEDWTKGSQSFGGVAGEGNDDFYYESHDQHGPSE